MTQSSSDDNHVLPVRGNLLACRYDSTSSTVSALSMDPSDFEDDDIPKDRSIRRFDRFKASGDRGLGIRLPERKVSLHKINALSNKKLNDCGSDHSALPPRIPRRVKTADRNQKNCFANAMNDNDRPGLNRCGGGVNVFSSH